MAELRDAGALGFTDDGKPVVSAGMLRKALQYQRLCGGVIALHEEDPALSGDGVMHEGAVSARLGLAGIPSVSESTMVARDGALAALRGRPRALPAPLVRRVGAGARRRPRRPARAVSGEATPAPPDADRRARAHARQPLQDEPAAARPRPTAGRLIEALRSGVIDCVATDHAPHARAREGGARSSRRRWGRPASRPRSPRSTPSWCCPASSSSDDRDRADDAPAARSTACRCRGSPSASRPTCASSTSRRASRSAPTATRAARRTAASTAARCTAGSC